MITKLALSLALLATTCGAAYGKIEQQVGQGVTTIDVAEPAWVWHNLGVTYVGRYDEIPEELRPNMRPEQMPQEFGEPYYDRCNPSLWNQMQHRVFEPVDYKEVVPVWPCDSILSGTQAIADASPEQAPVLMTAHVKQPKPPFAVRHPKIHAKMRKLRRTCQTLQPVVSFGGSVAQIVMMFRK